MYHLAVESVQNKPEQTTSVNPSNAAQTPLLLKIYWHVLSFEDIAHLKYLFHHFQQQPFIMIWNALLI